MAKRSIRTCSLAASLGAATLAISPLSGCNRGSPARGLDAASPQQAIASEASYLAPPRPTAVVIDRGGGLRVSGQAPRRSAVELVSPEGEQAQTIANARGDWTTRLPPSSAPKLYAISALLGGRTLHAEGALVTTPGAAVPAVVLRAGYAALPLKPGRATEIATVDYDPSGFIAVAGEAPPHARLALRVDGSPASVGQADETGRYALLAENRRLSLGAHQLQVIGPDRTAERAVTLDPPAPLTAPYLALPSPSGWRVEWALNGGGVQTTLILAP